MSDEYDRPKTKKKKPQDDEKTGWQAYKMSPIRFIILAALIAAAAVMGYMLLQKQERERNAERHPHASAARG
jgi:hypothetical protein